MGDYMGTSTTEKSVGAQALTAAGIITGLVITLFVVEAVIMSSRSVGTRYKTLMNYTADAEQSAIVIHQDLSKYPKAMPIGLSENERTGIEFAYSFYLYVHPSTFDGQMDHFKHVFHKGYSCPWPLMGPGVFLNAGTNTMRVVMSTYKNPMTYVDITNLPVSKWVHVVLNAYRGGLDVFINGNLANRISFKDTVPYQNFGDIILFSAANYSYPTANYACLKDNFYVRGTFKGMLSNLTYARYALSVGEIQGLLQKGPSSEIQKPVMQKPPYLADDWWAGQA